MDAIEVKWDGAAFEPHHLRTFRRAYPHGKNWLVTAQSRPTRERSYDEGLEVTSVSIEAWRATLAASLDGLAKVPRKAASRRRS